MLRFAVVMEVEFSTMEPTTMRPNCPVSSLNSLAAASTRGSGLSTPPAGVNQQRTVSASSDRIASLEQEHAGSLIQEHDPHGQSRQMRHVRKASAVRRADERAARAAALGCVPRVVQQMSALA